MSRGREANDTEKYGAALIQLGKVDRNRAKDMTAREIVDQFDYQRHTGRKLRDKLAYAVLALCDHDHDPVPKFFAGSNHPTNLLWRIRGSKDEIGTHRWKTAKIDRPAMAKSDRIVAEEKEFARRMLAKSEPGDAAGEEGTAKMRAKRAWPSQPLQSRGFDKWKKRRMT